MWSSARPALKLMARRRCSAGVILNVTSPNSLASFVNIQLDV